MRALDRKLLRDLWHMRGPVVAVALVAGCGVAAFVTMNSMVHHLGGSQTSYYAEGRFADVFALVRRAPESVSHAVAALPGVARVERRVAGDVVLNVPGLREPANAHVVGTRFGVADVLNRVILRRGRFPAVDATDEVVASEGFALANALRPGDRLGAVLGGRRRSLRVVGIGLSPEFIYELQGGSVFPDNRHFGVLWMPRDAAAAGFGMRGAFNDLAIALTPGASPPAVIEAIDRLLEPYGTPGAYGRDRHASHRFLTEEIKQNREFAAILPLIFLGVAAFLVHLVLSRVVTSQREQIGMLKAFGHDNATLVRHYVLMAVIPVLGGAVGGDVVGAWAARNVAVMYQDFFRFPHLDFHLRASTMLIGLVATVLAAAIGAVSAARHAATLPPADAMRPESPARFGTTAAERWVSTWRTTPVARMTLRTLLRRPVRGGLAVLGLALGMSVVIVGGFGYDAVAVIRDVQFGRAERADVVARFRQPVPVPALAGIARLHGAQGAEAVRESAVRVRHGHAMRHVGVVALDPAATLRRTVSLDGRPVRASEAGVTLSRPLAGLLQVTVGDTVGVEFLDGDRERAELPVAAFADDLLGMSVYLTVREWTRLRGGTDVITGAALQVEEGMLDTVYARLRDIPAVQSVGSTQAMKQNFDDTVARSFDITLGSLLVFAAALCVGVVYNTARIALSERGRELTSLRVLGFTRGEVARMLFGELLILALFAVPIGAALGALFAWLVVTSMGNTELFRLPFIIAGRTYVEAFAVLGAAGVASALLVRRRLDALDLVEVLKTRE